MTTKIGAHQTGRLVRPYAITGGRVGDESSPLALEAQVTATDAGARLCEQLAYEQGDIVRLAATPKAVIELAAHLAIPIGVVRVLVQDLADIGAVDIKEPPGLTAEPADEEYVNLLQRLRDGIQAL